MQQTEQASYPNTGNNPELFISTRGWVSHRTFCMLNKVSANCLLAIFIETVASTDLQWAHTGQLVLLQQVEPAVCPHKSELWLNSWTILKPTIRKYSAAQFKLATGCVFFNSTLWGLTPYASAQSCGLLTSKNQTCSPKFLNKIPYIKSAIKSE